ARKPRRHEPLQEPDASGQRERPPRNQSERLHALITPHPTDISAGHSVRMIVVRCSPDGVMPLALCRFAYSILSGQRGGVRGTAESPVHSQPPDPGPRAPSYCMDGAAMSLELHGCPIHAVW